MKRKRKQKKSRNMVVLGMILACKGGFMKDRRQERGGSKNKQKDYQNDDYW